MHSPPRPSRIAISLLTTLCLAALWASPAAASGPHDLELPSPEEVGPYAVGHTSFEIVDPSRDDRPLEIQAWYPADPEDAVGDPTRYDLAAGLLFLTSQNAIDDLPADDRSWRPLVVFSHGSGGINIQSIVLMETLASHGFVVVAPNHTGNAVFDNTAPFEETAVNRPLDVSFVIDRMLERSWDPEDMFFSATAPRGHVGRHTSIARALGARAIDVWTRSPR